MVSLPDFLEGMDILAAMRGTQNLCLDIYDKPDGIDRLIKRYGPDGFYISIDSDLNEREAEQLMQKIVY